MAQIRCPSCLCACCGGERLYYKKHTCPICGGSQWLQSGEGVQMANERYRSWVGAHEYVFFRCLSCHDHCSLDCPWCHGTGVILVSLSDINAAPGGAVDGYPTAVQVRLDGVELVKYGDKHAAPTGRETP